AEFVVDTSEKNPFDFILTPDALAFPFDYDERHRLPLAPCLAPPAESTRVTLHNWLDEHFVDRPADTVSFLVALNNLVHQSLRYARRHEQGIQSPTTTLGLASGSCRDYA